jgi:hypothetical protein
VHPRPEPYVLRVPKGPASISYSPAMLSHATHRSAMDTGFQIELLWNDNDVFKIRVSAWNGQFGGSADVYVPIGGLAETAAKLEGFPHQPSDTREIQFGAFGREWAGGGVACVSNAKMLLAMGLSKQESNPTTVRPTLLNLHFCLRLLKRRL